MGEVKWGFKDFVNVITVSCHLDRLLSEAIVLQLEHLVIVSLFGDKLIMSTHFGYLAVIVSASLVEEIRWAIIIFVHGKSRFLRLS